MAMQIAKMRAAAAVVALGACVGMSGQTAKADMVCGVTQITSNAAPAIAEQLSVHVASVVGDPTKVDFAIHNQAGGIASAVKTVLFDDAAGVLGGIAQIMNAPPAVNFTQVSGSPTLPGGESVAFNTTTGFGAEATAPPPQRGINPGEHLTIRFSLASGMQFQDVLDALFGGGVGSNEDGEPVATGLRIGMHVISIGGGNSNSFVTNITPIPLPSAAGMGATALLGVAGIRRRRAR